MIITYLHTLMCVCRFKQSLFDTYACAPKITTTLCVVPYSVKTYPDGTKGQNSNSGSAYRAELSRDSSCLFQDKG
jgi:hypothetical protein